MTGDQSTRDGETTAPTDADGETRDSAAEREAGPAQADGGDTDATAELEQMQRELQAINDRHLRLAAEFDNYRKRTERERAEQHTRSQAELVKRILDALDDLQRVEHVDPATTSVQAVLEGVDLVERKLRTALEAAGLEEVQAQGEFFNPATMEAVATTPAEHPEEDEVVSDVFQKGYRFGNTLLRPARVRVKKYEG